MEMAGWIFMYVTAEKWQGDDRANELYINQRNGQFKEEAHAYGLDDHGHIHAGRIFSIMIMTGIWIVLF